MKTKNTLFIVVLITGSLLAACGGTPTTSSPAETNSQVGIAPGACANALYPVKVGNTWNYQITGTASGSFTRTILEVNESGFTDQDTFPEGVTRTGKWDCNAGNLTSLNPSGGYSAQIQAVGTSSDFQTDNLTGVTLPSSIQAGDTWNQTLTLQGTTEIAGITADSSTDTTMSCTAGGSESVAVPAGTFDAMKITCQVTMLMSITMNGITAPTNIIISTDSWYAPGVGLVKSVSTGENISSILELTSYTLQ